MHCCRLCFNVGFMILIMIGVAHAHFGAKTPGDDDGGTSSNATDVLRFDKHSFIKYLFNKYGDDSGTMTFEGFEHLLEQLGLANVVINDHKVDDHKANGSFAEMHKDNHSSIREKDAHVDHKHDESYSAMDHDHERIHHSHHHSIGNRVRRSAEAQNSDVGDVKHHLDLPVNHECFSAGELFHVFGLLPGTNFVDEDAFMQLCPALIYELEAKTCDDDSRDKSSSEQGAENKKSVNSALTYWEIWSYATGSVVLISLCGLTGVGVVPMMKHCFYGPLLQFLIAMAIGALMGDACLHLLPQALSTANTHAKSTSAGMRHDGKHEGEHSHDKDQLWCILGMLAVMLGFFIVENTLPSFLAWREKHVAAKNQKKNQGSESNNKMEMHRKRCDLKSHGLASDQYRYDNQMVSHYMGEKLCREEGQCEVVACDNIPCSDQSCNKDSCVIVTEGACGGEMPDQCHSHASTSNNNDGLMPCFLAVNHKDGKHQCAEGIELSGCEKRVITSEQDLQNCSSSRRCSGKWSVTDGASTGAHGDNKRSSMGSVGIAVPDVVGNNAAAGGTKERTSTPCSFDKKTNDSEAQRRESDDDTCDEPDEKDALKKDKGVHHHHRHHHHHHHHIKPDSASAVAWMVIAGDGLHNLTDGIAIGSAFAVSYWGGLSTTVAVFCHELPHEVGDFAMLLATGMTVKQALLYNVLSSVLCFAGMAAGIFMVTNSPDGGEATISNWVSAATAGVFIYIALVDMIPELTNSDRGPKNPCLRVTIEVLGMLTGVLIMFVIAFHEDGFYSFLE